MESLEERIQRLEDDLNAEPMRISAYHDLPFAILQYPPEEELTLRKKVKHLATRLSKRFNTIRFISLASLLWEAVETTKGMDYVIESEKRFGYKMAEQTVSQLISDTKFRPLPDLVLERMSGLREADDLVFLVRAGAMAPNIYRMSMLLEEMHGRTGVPIVLFYPGTKEGETDLNFMGMGGRTHTGVYNYRVKIY